ncbi:glycosyltransferase family 4 protein [Thalassospira sp.]|uniref:glycosyltransferase family 4 protein n=1 Tax=Thalassospira sp. TaxID=1912094 RepID=UPI0032ECA0BF
MWKIAFPFVGDSVGGSHISALSLIQALPTDKVEARLVIHEEGPLTSYCDRLGLPYEVVDLPFVGATGGLRALQQLTFSAPQLAMWLRSRNFDLVHANDGRMIHSWMPAAALAGLPRLAHRRTKWVPSRISDRLFGFAERIVTISDFVYETVPPALKAKTCIVSNPVDFPDFDKGEGRTSLREITRNDDPVVMFVGTHQEQKQPHVFIEAAARIVDERPRTNFVLAGRKTELTSTLEAQAFRLGIGDRVFFTGYSEHVLRWLAGADGLIAPAIDEGHGRSLLEAMQAGIPVVASNSGGHVEALGNGRWGDLVDAGDSDAMAKAMLDRLRYSKVNLARCEMAAKHARCAYSSVSHARHMFSIYQEMLVL